MLKEERKKTAGPLKTMSWIMSPVEWRLLAERTYLAPNAEINLEVSMMCKNVKNADAVLIA